MASAVLFNICLFGLKGRPSLELAKYPIQFTQYV